MMTDKSDMQVATYVSSALTMPTDEFVELFMQPIEDDSWIRTEDIVKLDNLLENTQSMEKKREILKDYIEERAKLGPVKPDPILEGMLNQEKFMEEYIVSDHKSDADKASYYRQHLMSKFRRTHPDRPATIPFGEEDTDVDSSSSEAEKEEEAKRQAELEHQRRIAAGESSESSRNLSNAEPQQVQAVLASQKADIVDHTTNAEEEEEEKKVEDKCADVLKDEYCELPDGTGENGGANVNPEISETNVEESYENINVKEEKEDKEEVDHTPLMEEKKQEGYDEIKNDAQTSEEVNEQVNEIEINTHNVQKEETEMINGASNIE